MKHIWWLASYPKSGNTWVRALLSYYKYGTAHINSLMGDSFITSRAIFDEWLGLESSDLTLDEIDDYRHDYHLAIGQELQEETLIKVHDSYRNTPEERHLFPKEVTAGCLYLVRNPLDIVASYAHHENCDLDSIIKIMNDNKRYLLNHQDSLRLTLPQKLSSWSSHVLSWQNCPFCKVVRYEDLLQNTEQVFYEIVSHLGWEIDAQRIHDAVISTQFNKLKEQEMRYGFLEKKAIAESFFRQGHSGNWHKELTAEQIMIIKNNHSEGMERFNYL